MNRRQFLQSTLVTLIAPALLIVSVGAMVNRLPAPTATPTEWTKDFSVAM